MLLTLMLTMLGSASAFAADQLVDLEAEMFKAWDSNLPGANVVADPEPEPKSNGSFGCAYELYNNLDLGSTVYGSPNVYYLWYADLTGTKTMTVTGTPGMKIRAMFNRVPYEEGGTGDADGGAYIEWIETIGEDGQAVFDFTTKEEIVAAGYIHLNAIKLPWSGDTGVIKAIQLYGSVKPVSGWVDMLNNGDLEGDDLESFPVSHNGPKNGDTANDRPEIVELNGVKCMKVTSDDLAVLGNTDTWSCQFFFKFNEMLEEGTQYRLVLDVCADQDATITTSAQGAPRAWHAGFMDGFAVTNEWRTIEYEGTVTADQANNGGFGSVAFDLNNEPTPINFYFKNAHFYIYKEKSPLGQFTAGYQNDVVCIDLGENTNMKQLIQAAGGKRVIFPIDCASVKVDGQPTTLFSVEGKDNNKLFVFIDEGFSMEEDATVEVSFTNPADAAYHLTFTAGRFEGEDVPNWTDLLCPFQDGLGENYTYLADIPELKSTDPEDGSFNLPTDMTTFKVTFMTKANAEKLTAKLGNDVLTVSPSEGFATEFTLTHSGTIANGEHILLIDNVFPESDILGDEHFGTYEVTLNFGPVVIDPNDQQEVIYTSDFDGSGLGWIVNADAGGMQPASSGSGCRLQHGKSGFAADVLYLAQRGTSTGGVALYGTESGYELTLKAKTYHLTLDVAQWDAYDANKRYLLAQVFPVDAVDASDGHVLDEAMVLAEETQKIEPEFNNSQDATHFDIAFTTPAEGNYVIRLVPFKSLNADGTMAFGGYNDGCAIGNVKVEYIPNTVGGVETRLLNTALENAKSVMEGNAAERYAGADYDALLALIEKVEAEKAGYTAPSKYREMAAALDAAAQALKDHRAACDSYDTNIKKTCDIVRQVSAEEDNGKPNEKRKFMATPLYAEVCALAEKYHATSGWQNVGTEEEPNSQLQYSFDVLTDNEALATANAELSQKNLVADKMFTVGASTSNGKSGYAALHERLRVGVATLIALGVPEDDSIIMRANNILGDDDDMAEEIKALVKAILYGELKNVDNKLFEEFIVSENPLETSTPTYDMTVFVKNPNVYAPEYSTVVPGWVNISGNAYGWSSWNANDNHSSNTPYAEDCSLHPGWHAVANTEQTILDLPAGVYNITINANDNSGDDPNDSYVYVKTSSTPAVEEGAELNMDVNFAGYSYVDNGNSTHEIVGIEVTDGKLTIGCTWGNTSQAFFGDVRLALTAPAAGFDYASAYEEAIQGIETEVADNARVLGIEIYDLNGRRLANAQRGIQIVKKYMSNGTIRTEKVIIR